MTLQLEIERLRINAPASWSGGGDMFRAMLERALQEELQRSPTNGEVGSYQLMRVDMAPVSVADVHDMQEAAREIARRIVLTIRQNPE